MKATILVAAASFALLSAPILAQDEDGGGGEDAGELIVTGSLRQNSLSGVPVNIAAVSPPVIGLKRQADSAVRTIEIVSDSREAGMRQREVQAMLLAAIDRAKASGMSLVTGQFQLVEVTRDNWRDQFPGLAGKPDTASEDDEDDYDDEDEDEEQEAAFEDDGDSATVRLKLKTKLDGSLGGAHEKIARFIKSVPLSGRAQIHQKGGLALTIINPAQYRDKIYTLVAEGAKHAQSFYGPDYGVEVRGLDQDIAWKQVSNTEVFLYLPYSFTVQRN
jgi:hypothetical protein